MEHFPHFEFHVRCLVLKRVFFKIKISSYLNFFMKKRFLARLRSYGPGEIGLWVRLQTHLMIASNVGNTLSHPFTNFCKPQFAHYSIIFYKTHTALIRFCHSRAFCLRQNASTQLVFDKEEIKLRQFVKHTSQ